MFNVLTILLVFIFICILLYRKSNSKIKINVFDLENLDYPSSEVAPRSRPQKFIYGTHDDIKKHNSQNTYLEYKTVFDEKLNQEYDNIINNVCEKYNLDKKISNKIFRISSTPHRILAHFDCDDRYLIMIRGTKHILLFNLDKYSTEDQVRFLFEIKNIKMDKLKNILKDKGIDFKHITIKSGDVVHIQPGMYHYIENNTLNDYTIMLNIDYRRTNDYEKRWDDMWKGAEWIESN